MPGPEWRAEVARLMGEPMAEYDDRGNLLVAGWIPVPHAEVEVLLEAEQTLTELELSAGENVLETLRDVQARLERVREVVTDAVAHDELTVDVTRLREITESGE